MSTYDIAESLQGFNMNDFISQMPDDILVMILSLLPIKEAVVTSSLSIRWKFLWRNIMHLKFEGSEMPDNVSLKDRRELNNKYVNQVNSVIKSYSNPTVQHFGVRVSLCNRYKEVIDEWVRFALNKNVESLELDLMDKFFDDEYYKFTLILLKRNISHNVTAVNLVSLKQLILKKVNVSDTILQEFLTNSPHLETISIHRSRVLEHIRVGGQAFKLKHFEIVRCWLVKSIYLSDFDLVSFNFYGDQIDFRLSHLPKLEQINMRQGVGLLYENVLAQISSCNSFIKALSFNIYFPLNDRPKLVSFPLLPNVMNLRLRIEGRTSNFLINLASIMNLCPNLVTFTLEVVSFSPIPTRKTVDGPGYCHEHLKLLNIVGNYDDLLVFLSYFELVACLISNVVALKKIVIDSRTKAGNVATTSKDISQNVKVVQKLESLKPQGVELAFL